MENLEINKVELPTPEEFMEDIYKVRKLSRLKQINAALNKIKSFLLKRDDFYIGLYDETAIILEINEVLKSQGYELYKDTYRDYRYYVIPIKYAVEYIRDNRLIHRCKKVDERETESPQLKSKSLIDRFFSFFTGAKYG